MDLNNAEALRTWLRQCPELGDGRAFGADYLGQDAGEVALRAAPSELRYRENILGGATPLKRQAQDYWLDARLDCGGEVGQNVENLGMLQRVAAWILRQNAEGRFPERSDGRVTAVLPSVSPAPTDFGGEAARYRLRIRVCYDMNEQTGGN